jgi:RNA polymerase sigma-70 factor (ECF subfamily)
MPDPQSENESEAAWLAALKAGESDALERCYRAHADELLRLAYRLTGHAQDAEDVVQDVFVGLPDALRRYVECGSFGSWLRRVTARSALMHARRVRNRREAVEDVETLQLRAPSTEGQANGAGVERALAMLSPALSEVFVLRVMEGYSHLEIAALLGITVSASEVRLHRAIRRLRIHLRSLR